MRRRLLIRIGLWVAVLAAVILIQLLPWGPRVQADPVPPPGQVMRVASPSDWAKPIAELGVERKAKQLVVLWTKHDATPPFRGQLAWWHDGAERFSYCAPPGEDATTAMVELMRAVVDGSAALYDFSGDPGVLERLQSMPPDPSGLPPDWVLLTPPRP